MARGHCMLDPKGYEFTHSECVIVIAFGLQQRLHQRVSVLRLYINRLYFQFKYVNTLEGGP
jgi:hypothetical protein